MTRSLRLLAALVPALCSSACAVDTGAVAKPIPVIYDGDMDVDDAAALAVLCEAHKQHRIDLLAVTVDDNGFGVAGRALVHARRILRQCGLPNVPTADGATGTQRQIPATVRAKYDAAMTNALSDGDVQVPPPATATPPTTAAELLAMTISTSPTDVTVVATGTLTNLAQALFPPATAAAAEGSGLAHRIKGLYYMGGAVAVPGNLLGTAVEDFDNSQECNVWLDPASARQVFRAVRPDATHLVPLDATGALPITARYVDRLGADGTTASSRMVHDIMTQPAVADAINRHRLYWSDVLAAIWAVDGDITGAQDEGIDVVLDGRQSGRTTASAAGARMQVAAKPDQRRFEQAFLDALNGG
jgi:purine nucleosidase